MAGDQGFAEKTTNVWLRPDYLPPETSNAGWRGSEPAGSTQRSKNGGLALTPDELLEQASKTVPGSPDWALYYAAAFDAVVEHPQILVGDAQVVRTEQHRPADIDIGRIAPRDMECRHRVYARNLMEGVDVEVPDAVLVGQDPPEIVDVAGHRLRVISLDDLMMDRLVQATDRTPATWDEVIELGEATFDRVNWDKVRTRVVVQFDPPTCGFTLQTGPLPATGRLRTPDLP